MKNKFKLITVIIVFAIVSVLGALSGGSVFADTKKYKLKHDQVFQQRQLKDILPLEEILKVVRPQIKGELIEAELEIEDGTPIYEFKYINSSGRVMEIYVNAKTGNILKEEID